PLRGRRELMEQTCSVAILGPGFLAPWREVTEKSHLSPRRQGAKKTPSMRTSTEQNRLCNRAGRPDTLLALRLDDFPPTCYTPSPRVGRSRHHSAHGWSIMQAYLGAIWRCRYFWLSLVRMDLRHRYRGSVLGLGWSLLHPIAMTAILCTVFHHLF